MQDTEHFLINPFGTLYSEVTASSLIKVDMQGNVVEPGTTNYGVNVAGFLMHSAVHANRPDLKCVLHLRNPPVTSVSLEYHTYSAFFVHLTHFKLYTFRLRPSHSELMYLLHLSRGYLYKYKSTGFSLLPFVKSVMDQNL